MIILKNIKLRDKITFTVPPSQRTFLRAVVGLTSSGVVVRYGGSPGYLVRPSDIVEHEPLSATSRQQRPVYIRSTVDEFQIHGHFGHGWEEVDARDTMKEARSLLTDYNKNDPKNSYKIITKRIPREAGQGS